MSGHIIITAGFSRWRAILPIFILLAVILWFGLTFYAASQWRRSEAAATQLNALRLAYLASGQQARSIGEAQALLSGLALLPVIRGTDPARCRAHLSTLFRDNAGYAVLGVMKPNGDVFCSAGPISNPSDLADRPAVRHAVETRNFAIGEYQMDRRTGQTVLTLVMPVLNTVGRVQAVVFAELDLAWIRGLLAEAQLPYGAAYVVLDQNGTILTREPDRERWVGQSGLGVPVFRTVLEQGRAGMAEGIGLDGVQRLFGYSPLITSLRGGNAYVVVAIPITGAFAAFERTMVREFAKLGLLVALAMAVTWVASDLVLRRRVKTLVSATERLRLGDLSARTGLSYGRGRIGRLASAFDEMAAALEARRAEAERTEAALRALNEALEQEARRIGQALHDEAGQLLAVIYMGLDRCALDLPPAVQARLREVRGHLDLVEGQLRHLSHELRPTILEDLGVVPALRFLAEGVSKRTDLAIIVEGDTDGRLPVMVENALYRVVQEALANAAKHAKAGSVRIQLHREDRQIRCAVLDDGIGFELSAALAKKGDRGLGLIGMQERLKGVEGALQITSNHGQGTALHITIPLGA